MADMLTLDAQGWLCGVTHIASPHFDERSPGIQPELLVVHAISLPPDEFGGPGVAQLFAGKLDPEAHPYYAQIQHLRVSAHFFIRRDGEIIQFVSVHDRAWHAGVSSWQGREQCNDFSIGIELEGCDALAFESVQYERLASLTDCLFAASPVKDVQGHSAIAPGRKTDPGPHFDWQRFRSLCKSRWK
jgi:AmpD protein